MTEPVSRALPSRARVVVVGGGVGGTSVAYHLALAGERDVVLVDRDELFASVCRIAVEHGRFRFAWIGLIDENNPRLKPVARLTGPAL